MTAVLTAVMFIQLAFGGAPAIGARVEVVERNGPDEGLDGQGGHELPPPAAQAEIVRALVAAPVQIVRIRDDRGALVAAPAEILRGPGRTTTTLAPEPSNESPLPGAPSLP
jgi:hypothetical protein